jgi:hypothetical protein
VAVVIGSAVIPTMIANAAFLSAHLLPPSGSASQAEAQPAPAGRPAADQPLEEG